MPVYDYTCAACGRRFEVHHGVHADGPTACPLCGKGPVRKAITAAAVHYRGSGWAKKERHAAASSSKRGGSDGDSTASDPTGKDDAGSTSKGDTGSSEAATPAAGSKKAAKKAEASPATASD
jgi:putative FmdB family regulatory protein